MAQRDAEHGLSGVVQVDDAYLCGERFDGTRGRGSQRKLSFVTAVSLNEQGSLLHNEVAAVVRFSSEASSNWAQLSIEPGAQVYSDGLICFAAVIEAG